MAGLHKTYRENFVGAFTGDSTLTTLLPSGASSITWGYPTLSVDLPHVTYSMVSYAYSGALSFPRSPRLVTMEVVIHANDPDEIDEIDEAIDDIVEDEDKLSSAALSSADVTVTGFAATGPTTEDFDPRHLALENIVMVRRRLFVATIMRPSG